KYTLWPWHSGGIFMAFNFRRGPFQDKRLRTAAAHAIDRQAIHNAVFYGQGDMLDQPYPRGNFWHLESQSVQYDPDKAKTLLKQAGAVGTPLKIICISLTAAALGCGQIVQEQWNSVGFKVDLQPLDTIPFLQARKHGDFDGLINGHTFRFDPDDFFGRNLYLLYLSTSLLWWQAVAAIIGVTSSTTLRHNSRCTWRHSEGAETAPTPPIPLPLGRRAQAGVALQAGQAPPQGVPRRGHPPRTGDTRGPTPGEP